MSLKCNNNDYEIIRALKLSRETINRLTTNLRIKISMLYRFNLKLIKQFKDFKFFINALSEDRKIFNKVSLFKKYAMF